jgi:hypothetical protein
VRTKPRNSKRAEHEVDSSSDSSYDSNEETDGDANDSYYAKEEKQKNEDGVGPLKCLGPGLYGWEADDEFVEWLQANPTSEDEDNSSMFVGMIEFCKELDFNDECPDLATLVDDITWEDVCNVEVDGTMIDELESLMDEEEVCPPPRLVKTPTGTKVVTDELQGVVKYWNPIPNEAPHVPEGDWKLMNVAKEGEDPKYIKVGKQLSDEEVEGVKEFRDVFAWSYEDLGNGIPIEVASHSIPLIPEAKPVRQRQRPMNPRLELLVRKELEKLIRAGFIQPVELTTWVSPMVIVRKKNGKLRVCIDYRALNKVTLKDHFPLPFMNNILEEVACHAMYSFADGYSGYNQIHVVQQDWYKTAFTTPWGTFIYIVMQWF